jgi:hypothetical protein
MAWEIAWDSFKREPNIQKVMWAGQMRTLRGAEYPYHDKDSGHQIALQAMKLAKDCYQTKMQLPNGRITLDKSVRFVQSRKTRSIEADTGAIVTNTTIAAKTLYKREQGRKEISH